MAHKLNITEMPIEGKKVLVRVDFNVPLNKDGQITDDTRILASIPTIEYILQRGGIPILMSHLGRPKDGPTPSLSLKPVAKRLSELLGRDVELAPDCIGLKVQELVQKLTFGKILLLENLRFYKAEEEPDLDPTFAKKLAALADFYVNDAFGTAHRAHTSTVSVPKLFPGAAAGGFLLEKEIQFLGKTLVNPKHPFTALLGGAKISTKLGILKSLITKADSILLGGAMAFTFFKAMGISIGNSLYEEKLVNEAKNLIEQAKKSSCTLILPIDIVIAKELKEGSPTDTINIEKGIPEGWIGVDIGPKSVEKYKKILEKSETAFWNGPMGVFEIQAFATGTLAMAEIMASIHATTVVGGGDSIAAINKAGVEDRIDHISTGGGATLEYIEYGTLPGIDALSDSLISTASNK